ncbi:fluoride efflux transporter FluC [Dietzia cercidiphylli]|uniref:fluoride efflux transporter FluC n=1 Tax=Dietzia cercidiphylli TaxID=498199 RepID=UPI00223C2912|nr:CrcB family protein [Dietzia cercidiphylli]MCT1515697.1 CrcB family protein [Dietzia cercidiphylli]
MSLPVAVGLVALGGAVGSALRATVAVMLPGTPLGATLAVNVLGAFLLGLVLEWLAASGERLGERRRAGVRLLLGTGVCGGFTTYSAVTEHAAELLRDGDATVAAAYVLVTLLLGALATLAGVGTAALLTARADDRDAGSEADSAVDGNRGSTR